MGVSQNWGYHFGGPHNKDYSIIGYTLGPPDFGKLPYGSSKVVPEVPLRGFTVTFSETSK